MEFRNLKAQYHHLKAQIDSSIGEVIEESAFISGKAVRDLEQQLADYVGVRHCITCGNGTDALSLVLRAWGIGPGDAVFVPDFTSSPLLKLHGIVAPPLFLWMYWMVPSIWIRLASNGVSRRLQQRES